jgi:hypothetical protein
VLDARAVQCESSAAQKESHLPHNLRQLARLASLLALATAAMPAAASARTEWYYERQPVLEGETVAVDSSGTLKLKLRPPGHRIGATCTVGGVEAVWNASETGLGETRAISFSCTGEVVISPQLPWTSVLSGASSSRLLDEWNRVQLDVSRAGVDYGVFAGTLGPTIGDGDPQGPGRHDDLDNTLSFHSTGPRLLGPNGATLSFVGFYKLGTRGQGATGEAE